MKYDKHCNSAKTIRVIETTTLYGKGSEQNPRRLLTQYWSLDGKLLAENDPLKNTEDK